MEGFGTSPLELMASDAMLQQRCYCDAFSYSATWLKNTDSELSSQAVKTVTFTVDSGSDFVVQEANIVAVQSGGTVELSPDFLIEIVAAGSARPLMNQEQHVLTLLGGYAESRHPARWAFPRLIAANSTISNKLTNRTTHDYDFVQVTYRGFRVYYTGGNRQQIFHVL